MSMTRDQALKALAELVEAGGMEHYEKALEALRDPLVVQVDEVMVHRASRAYNVTFFFTSPATHDQAMKAALVAALGEKRA